MVIAIDMIDEFVINESRYSKTLRWVLFHPVYYFFNSAFTLHDISN